MLARHAEYSTTGAHCIGRHGWRCTGSILIKSCFVFKFGCNGEFQLDGELQNCFANNGEEIKGIKCGWDNHGLKTPFAVEWIKNISKKYRLVCRGWKHKYPFGLMLDSADFNFRNVWSLDIYVWRNSYDTHLFKGSLILICPKNQVLEFVSQN